MANENEIEEKKEDVLKQLTQCRDKIEYMGNRMGVELGNTVLTWDAIEVHDKLEKMIIGLEGFLKLHLGKDIESLPVRSTQTLLPDLVLATALFKKKSQGLLGEVSKQLESLERILNESKKQFIVEKFKFWFSGLHKLLGKLRLALDKTRECATCISGKHPWLESHDFLSQQIDERSHQIFILGSLFVPVSFLIFSQAVTSSIGFPVNLLPMAASLTCYFTWLLMYLRANRLNQSSYPIIHALELTLNLSSHLTLKEIRDRDSYVQMIPRRILASARIILPALWIPYLLASVLYQVFIIVNYTYGFFILVSCVAVCFTPSVAIVTVRLPSDDRISRINARRAIVCITSFILTSIGISLIIGWLITQLAIKGILPPRTVQEDPVIMLLMLALGSMLLLIGVGGYLHGKVKTEAWKE